VCVIIDNTKTSEFLFEDGDDIRKKKVKFQYAKTMVTNEKRHIFVLVSYGMT
jgi:hypothetical protein